MRKYVAVRLAGLFCLFAVISAGAQARAQVTLPPQRELEPKTSVPPLIQLDRAKIRAFEPIYLCLTAEQFPPGVEAEVQIGFGDKWVPVTIPDKDWVKTKSGVVCLCSAVESFCTPRRSMAYETFFSMRRVNTRCASRSAWMIRSAI